MSGDYTNFEQELNMNRCGMLVNIVITGAIAVAGCATGHNRPRAANSQSSVPDRSGLGNLNHPVSTSNRDAQRAFDEGLTLVYGFNHDEAIRRFTKAAELDPKLAMAHWGIALALGPNYNIDVGPPREKAAYEQIQTAMKLAQSSASQPEKDYIAALAKRYSNDPNADLKKLARDYAAAMKELSQKYPDDLDAATLYADAMMNLRPWKLYTPDGKPEEGTDQIVAALESVLKRNPDHVGANHLYIHAVEASTHPERAMEAAARLPGLAPAAGHLVHMPSHVYIRTGDYEAASNTNVAAVEVDEDFLKQRPDAGVYAMMYYPHNIHFVAVSRAIEGRSKESIAAAEKLAKQVQPHVAMMPPLEAFCTIPDFVLVKLHRWDEILARPEPDATKMPLTHAAWRFARGCAFAGKGDVNKAQAEHDALASEVQRLPSDSLYGMLNRTKDVFDVADKYLQARIAIARKDNAAAIELLGSAVKAEDNLTYSEPPDWIIPCREALGSALMRAGKFADAEQVFRADLQKNARSGRSLCGLRESLKAQGKMYDAQLVDQQLQSSWKNADVKLDVMDL